MDPIPIKFLPTKIWTLNPLSGMHPDAPYFSNLLCLMPENFTHQVESAASQLVNINC